MKQMMLLSSQFLFAVSWLTPSKTKLVVCELFLEISQDFEIFNWQTVSLLTKIVLGKKKLIQFTNGASVMFHSSSGFTDCLKKEAECPGKSDLLDLSIYCLLYTSDAADE